jgi:hypothetical protein
VTTIRRRVAAAIEDDTRDQNIAGVGPVGAV